MDWPTEDICKYFSSNHWIVMRNQLGGGGGEMQYTYT